VVVLHGVKSKVASIACHTQPFFRLVSCGVWVVFFFPLAGERRVAFAVMMPDRQQLTAAGGNKGQTIDGEVRCMYVCTDVRAEDGSSTKLVGVGWLVGEEKKKIQKIHVSSRLLVNSEKAERKPAMALGGDFFYPLPRRGCDVRGQTR
jgi:hypothetical protein